MARIHAIHKDGRNGECGYLRTGSNEARFTTVYSRITCRSCKNYMSGKWTNYWYSEEGKAKAMLTGNSRIALANLDWLIYHLNMRLDYAAGVVYASDGSPEFTLDDLATIGLTPATEPDGECSQCQGKGCRACDSRKARPFQSVYGVRPHTDMSPADLARKKETEELFSEQWLAGIELGPE